MQINGLEKLKEIEELNVRACRDEDGWHLDIWKRPEGISFRSKEFWKRIKENVVVDLADENNCKNADDVRELYDELMELYHTKQLHKLLDRKYFRNGVKSICSEVDVREVKLKLSSYQLELLQDGAIGSIIHNTDFNWDINDPENKEEFELLRMVHFTKVDKIKLDRLIKDNRYDYLNSNK